MRRVVAAMLGLVFLVAGCLGDPATPRSADEEQRAIEVFTLYRGADAAAFRRVLDEFEAMSGYDVNHVGTASFAARIQQRVNDADPPDVAMFPQPGLIRALAVEGQLASLESLDVAGPADLREQFPDVLEAVTVGGELYGVPWRVDVKSLVWYRPEVFEALGYRVPTDFFDFQALVSQMAFDGATPWCLGMGAFEATGWVGTDWIEDIVLRTQPADVYHGWAVGQIRFDDQRIQEAMRVWSDLALAPGRSFGPPRDLINTPWEDAGDPLFGPEPACLMHRQLGGYRAHLPEATSVGPGGDVNFFVMPASEPGDKAPLLVNGEIAAAFTSKPGVAELMLFLADPRSAESWAGAGGYVSPHLGFDPQAYGDDFERKLAELIADADVVRYDASDTMPPSVGVGTFWDGVVEFVATGDLDRSVATIDNGYTDDSVLSCRLQGVDGDC